MTDYKSKLGSLAHRLKNEPQNTPIQEVHPVKESDHDLEEEVRFNNWIPRSLKKKLKAYAVENDVSLKEINIEALEEYLKGRIRQKVEILSTKTGN